ncbi:ABC transporter substrate-binding protein [Peredibacter sp. HCB2-198]|uniref:ABC transporter substrate-binding protein n=1 Tax=Peredibacter sp. HCB2-198 TaxID=3383025 RepID=UPI0038B4AF6D
MKRVLFLLKFSLFFAVKGYSMSTPLKLYFGEDSKAPYHIHAGGIVLSTFNSAVRGQLIKVDDKLNLKPSHLKDFKFDYKSNTYTLQLRDNLYFHNGRKVTSQDLEFSLLRGFFSPDKSFFNTYLYQIEGLDKIKAGDKFYSGIVSGIKLINETTISVLLSSPNPAFLHTLTVPYFSLVPKEELHDDYLTWKSIPVGAGQYRVKHPFDGEKTIIEKISDQSASPKEVWFLANLKNNRPDISLERHSIDKKNLEAFSSSLPGNVRVLEFSRINELSRDEDFKKALDSILYREEFSNKELGISPINQLLPSHFWGRIKQEASFAKSKKEILEKLPNKYKGKKLKAIVFSGPELSEKNKFYVTKITNLLNKYGLDIEFVPNDEKFISKTTAESAAISMFGMVCDYIDPLIMFSAYRKNSHANYYLPSDTLINEYEARYMKAANAKKFDERISLVSDLSSYVKNNSIIIPIAEEKTTFYFNREKIVDVGNQPHPISLNIENIKLRE